MSISLYFEFYDKINKDKPIKGQKHNWKPTAKLVEVLSQTEPEKTESWKGTTMSTTKTQTNKIVGNTFMLPLYFVVFYF